MVPASDNPSITRETASDGGCRITVQGELDLYSAYLLESALEKAGDPITLDLRNCRYIDSSAITTLVRCRNRSAGNLRIIAKPQGTVRRVLELTQLDKVISVVSSD